MKTHEDLKRELQAEYELFLQRTDEGPIDFWDGRELVCTYVYRGANGAEAFFKDRYALDPQIHGRDKDFRIKTRRVTCQQLGCVREGRSTGSWHYHAPRQADAVLYRLPEAVAAVEAGEPIWWPEGEKDADNLRAAGVAAVSHWQGAGKATLAQAMWLQGAPEVVLVVDKDGDHPEVGAYDAARRYAALVEAGVDVNRISVVKAAEGKDASDHLEGGYGLEDFVAVDLERLASCAERFSTSGARRAGYR